MTINISKPPDPAKVKANTVCVQGQSKKNGQGSILVKAKIYEGHNINPPATPPNDAIAGTAGESFGFTSVGGAFSDDTEPYPENTLVVWAAYPGAPNQWENLAYYFLGKTDTKTDCET